MCVRMYGSAAHSIGSLRNTSGDWLMFGFYIRNNIGITLQCYVTGILFGPGSVSYTVYNGALAGVVAGYVVFLRLGETFFPFVAARETNVIISGVVVRLVITCSERVVKRCGAETDFDQY